MKKALFLILILFLLLACHKERLRGEREILIGTWEWQNTEIKNQCAGYWQYEEINPITEGNTYQARIYKKAKIEFLRNNEVFEEYSFTVREANIPEGIAESTKKIDVWLDLDGEPTTLLRIFGTTKNMGFYFYPFAGFVKDDCQHYCSNYFKKLP